MLPFAWKLRLLHLGGASVRVEHPGGILEFDPWSVPEEGATVVITRADPLAVRGALDAVRQGRRPNVLADEEILHWLSRHGALSGDVLPLNTSSLALAALPYDPPRRSLRDLGRAIKAPRPALDRARIRRVVPNAKARVVEVTFPSGARLVHLGRALHARADAGWIEQATKRFHGVDWLIAGVEPGDHAAYAELVARFSAKRTLVADLVHDPKGGLKPGRPVTPLADQLVASGREAYVFAKEASLRFE